MAKVELKQPVVDEISALLKDAEALVAVDYRGLTVEEDTQLRKSLREAGVTYKVYKNTLIKRAVAGTEWRKSLTFSKDLQLLLSAQKMQQHQLDF